MSSSPLERGKRSGSRAQAPAPLGSATHAATTQQGVSTPLRLYTK
jgi:hypothetical protein